MPGGGMVIPLAGIGQGIMELKKGNKSEEAGPLYKDVDKLIEDFFANFSLSITPKAECDEVAAQRVKETLIQYLLLTGEDGLDPSKTSWRKLSRTAFRSFLEEIYFTLDSADEFGELEDELDGLDDDEWDEDEDDDYEEIGDDFFSIFSFVELCDMIIEDPEVFSEMQCFMEKAFDALREEGHKKVVIRLEGFIKALEEKWPGEEIREVVAEAQLVLCELHVEVKALDKALESFNKAATRHGHLPSAFARIANVEEERGNRLGAIEALKQVISLEPHSVEPYLWMADIYQALGQAKEMAAIIRECLEFDPSDARTIHRMIMALQIGEEGQGKEAETLRGRILALNNPIGAETIAIWVKYKMDAGAEDSILEFLHRTELDDATNGWINLVKAIVFQHKRDQDNLEVELLLYKEKMEHNREEHFDYLRQLAYIFGDEALSRLRFAINSKLPNFTK